MTLSDPDPTVRLAFVRKLASQPDEAVVPHLLKALRDADSYDVRKEAADALEAWDRPEVVEALVDVVLNEWDLRWPKDYAVAARGSLARMPGFRTWLLDALNHGDDSVRERANESIGRVDAPIGRVLTVRDFTVSGDVEVLVACLEHGGVEVRPDAADALAEIGDPVAIPALTRALDDDASGVASAAAAALERIRDLSEGDDTDRLIARLRATDLDARKVATRALGDVGEDRAVDALAAVLVDPDWLFPYASERGKIKSPPDSLALEFPIAVADALAATKDERAADALLHALGSPESAVRLAAARGLGSLGDKRAEGPLASIATSDDYKYFPDMDSNEVRYPVREAAKEALACMGSEIDGVFESRIQAHTATVADAEAREVLGRRLPWSAGDIGKVERLADEDSGVVAEALLARIEQDPSSFDRMASDISVCRLMVRAVRHGGNAGEKAGAAVLRVILGRHRALDRGRKRAGIAGMWPDNVDIITEAWSCLDELDARPAKAAAEFQREDVNSLIARLNDDPHTRVEVAAELGKRGDSQATRPLLDVLGDAYLTNDRKSADRVLKALASLGRAVPDDLAAGLVHDVTEVRWAVAGLLGDIGSHEVVPALQRATTDPDEGVREAAEVAIERIQSR